MCVKHALESFVHLLKGSLVSGRQIIRVLLLLFSSVVPRFICINWLWKLFCSTRNTMLALTEWIPRSENEVADYLIKIVKDSYFRAVDYTWGPFTVDCFANSVNAKVSRFYSLFFQPGCLGVDSLAFDWGQESCWLVPPVCLIPRALMHFLNCRSRGTLVVPFWPSSLFWPYLICENGAFRDFVVDFLFVKNGAEVFVQGANKETCFGS